MLKKRRNYSRDLMLETLSGTKKSIGCAIATNSTPMAGLSFLVWIAIEVSRVFFVRMERLV